MADWHGSDRVPLPNPLDGGLGRGGLPCRAVAPALRRPLADVIGVNTHYGTDVDPGIDRFAAAGVRLVRNDLTWEQIEREPGQYDFSGPDRVVAALERRGRTRPRAARRQGGRAVERDGRHMGGACARPG